MANENGPRYRENSLVTEKFPWMTLPRAIEEAYITLETKGGADADRVHELAEYLKTRMIDAANLAGERRP